MSIKCDTSCKQCIKIEFQKIINFLNPSSDENSEKFPQKDLPRFVTKKWIKVYDQSGGNYNVDKKIRIKTSMLRSDLCDFNVYIVVKGNITLEVHNDVNKRIKNLAFKNNVAFINCVSKIDGFKIDNAEDLDVVMSIYNLLEYSKNY